MKFLTTELMMMPMDILMMFMDGILSEVLKAILDLTLMKLQDFMQVLDINMKMQMLPNYPERIKRNMRNSLNIKRRFKKK